MSMRQYEWFELVFSSAEPKGSFVQIPLHAACIEKDGGTWNMDGFYSGKRLTDSVFFGQALPVSRLRLRGTEGTAHRRWQSWKA